MRYGKLNSRSIFWICIFFISTVFFFLFSNICFPFIFGFILAYLCAPSVEILSKHLNRSIVSVLFVLSIVGLLIFAGLEIVPKLKDYLVFLSRNIPDYYSKFVSFINKTFSSVSISQHYIDISSVKIEIQQYLDKKVYILASIVEQIASKREAIASFFSFFIIMPISFFYFLKDWNHMNAYFYKCVPHQHRKIFSEISIMIRKTFKNFLNGQFYVAVALSIYYSISLLTVGTEHNVYLGILSGILSFIPFIGALFACILVLFISVPFLTMAKFYIIITIYFVGQFVEGYLLYPRFVGKKTGLHPLWILFSFFAGIELNGIIGVLIAIPSAAVIRNLIGFAIHKFKSTQAYKQ